MLDARRVRRALSGAPEAPFVGVVSRFCFEAYRKFATSPVGASGRGGRYNSPGTEALYTSFRRTTALSEFSQDFADDDPIAASSMLSLIVNLRKVADVTGPTVPRAMGTSKSAICDIRVPGIPFVAQTIGDEAVSLGFDGLRVWSALEPSEYNLVVFPVNFAPLTVRTYVVTSLRSP